MQLTRRHLLTIAAASPAILLSTRAAFAATPEVYAENGIAVDGSDVVAYFTQSEAVMGDANITHDYMGATWQFSSEDNKAAFVADPTAYAPQYGGYCAFAVSKGATAPTVPEAPSCRSTAPLRARTAGRVATSRGQRSGAVSRAPPASTPPVSRGSS